MLTSALCTEEQLTSETFLEWADRMKPAWDHDDSGRRIYIHRKMWEWIFIAQALRERGMLAPGRRGLGFGVGTEPLAALFASFGAEIVATDLDTERAQQSGWVETGQHASALEQLNEYRLCDPAEFEARVSFRVVDMNHIPDDLTGFDFCWSSCSFEHLGSLAHGQDFVLEAMHCIVPGGVAVHTTEYNVSSNRATVDHEQTVLYRRRDVEWLVRALRGEGHRVDVDFDTGRSPADLHVDAPPFSNTHLKVQLGDYVATSLGLIVEKGQPTDAPARPFRPVHALRRGPAGRLAARATAEAARAKRRLRRP